MVLPVFDVVIAGGGLAGSSLGGLLDKSGLGVLVVEKESGFRDRIRGERSWPWGYAEASRAGLAESLEQLGVVPLPEIVFYQDRQRVGSLPWASISNRPVAGDRVLPSPAAGGAADLGCVAGRHRAAARQGGRGR